MEFLATAAAMCWLALTVGVGVYSHRKELRTGESGLSYWLLAMLIMAGCGLGYLYIDTDFGFLFVSAAMGIALPVGLIYFAVDALRHQRQKHRSDPPPED